MLAVLRSEILCSIFINVHRLVDPRPCRKDVGTCGNRDNNVTCTPHWQPTEGPFWGMGALGAEHLATEKYFHRLRAVFFQN